MAMAGGAGPGPQGVSTSNRRREGARARRCARLVEHTSDRPSAIPDGSAGRRCVRSGSRMRPAGRSARPGGRPRVGVADPRRRGHRSAPPGAPIRAARCADPRRQVRHRSRRRQVRRSPPPGAPIPKPPGAPILAAGQVRADPRRQVRRSPPPGAPIPAARCADPRRQVRRSPPPGAPIPAARCADPRRQVRRSPPPGAPICRQVRRSPPPGAPIPAARCAVRPSGSPSARPGSPRRRVTDPDRGCSCL